MQLFCSIRPLFSDVAVAVVVFLGPVHTNPFSNENGAFFAPFSNRFAPTVHVFVSFSPVHTTTPSIVFKSLHFGERFRMAPFSVIVFGFVVSTIAVSGPKQLRFRLKMD